MLKIFIGDTFTFKIFIDNTFILKIFIDNTFTLKIFMDKSLHALTSQNTTDNNDCLYYSIKQCSILIVGSICSNLTGFEVSVLRNLWVLVYTLMHTIHCILSYNL